MNKREIDFKFLYPNLIIFLSSDPKDSLFKKLQKSFNEFRYGPFFKEEGSYYKHELGRQVSTCRIKQGSNIPICLAEGEGSLPCDAEEQAAERLLAELCDKCYVIKANPRYMKLNILPDHVLNADPSQSHVYKVVYLKNNSFGALFRKPVSGAIDYVENYDNLLEYIDNHGKSNTKADLFILNILKADRKIIKDACQKNGLTVKNLVGCSDMGLYAYYNMSSFMILQSLLKDGGKNIKYELIGPRDKCVDNKVKKEEEEKLNSIEDVEEAVGGLDNPSQDEGEIVINKWIADHLVLMDIITEKNEFELPRETIWQSVKACPDTQEFIIEKKRKDTGMILAEALIDRYIVGKARGYQEKRVKLDAAENAFQNLSKSCNYIEAKMSYFGSSQHLPHFLQQPNPVPETKVYRIADKNSGLPNKILQQFKTARQEDLFFLDDFTAAERNKISNIAKMKYFLVRWIGRQRYLCVYKKRKPKDVLMELLSMPSKENEKYKLHVPVPKSHQQMERRTAHQDWTNQEVTHGTQADCPPVHEPHCSTTVRDTQGYYKDSYTSECGSSRVDHGIASESRAQGAEASEQKKDEVPNWVMSFIQSAPVKNVNRPKPYINKKRPKDKYKKAPKDPNDIMSLYSLKPPRVIPPRFPKSNFNFQRSNRNVPPMITPGNIHEETHEHIDRNMDNVFSRYQFIPPKSIPPPVSNSNVNFQMPSTNFPPPVSTSSLNYQEPNQRPNQNVERVNTNPNRDVNKPLTLSERLQQTLQQKKLSNNQDSSNGQNKQAPLNATNKRSLDQGEDDTKEWAPSEKNIKPSSYSSSYEMESCKQEWSNVKIEKEPEKEIPTLFDRRPEPTQQNNSLWDQGTKRHFDQRINTSTREPQSFSNLFDFNGSQTSEPQGPSRPTYPPRSPPHWKMNKQFKGHKFSKIQKYCNKKGPRAPY